MRRRSHPDMIEGVWQAPPRNLTWAQAKDAAAVLRPYFDGEALAALEEAERLAAHWPQVDVVDAFCDGISAILYMPKAERPAAVLRMRDDCRFASYS